MFSNTLCLTQLSHKTPAFLLISMFLFFPEFVVLKSEREFSSHGFPLEFLLDNQNCIGLIKGL